MKQATTQVLTGQGSSPGDLDFVGNSQASVIKNGGDFDHPAFRSNASLRDDQWKEIDDAVLEISREVQNGIADIRDAGLVRETSLGTLFSQYETVTGTGDAEVTMSGEASDERNRVETTLNTVPVPFITKGFSFSARFQDSAQRDPGDLISAKVEDATFRVNKKLEDILFNGSRFTVDGNTIKGYTDHPDRNQTSAAGGWDTVSNIYGTIENMMSDLESAGYPASWILYVADPQFGEMRAQNTNTDTRVLDTVRDYDELQAVRRNPALPDGEAVMIKPSRRVVDLVLAEDVSAIEAEGKFGRTIDMQIAGVMAPRVKSDDAGNSGVSHVTGI